MRVNVENFSSFLMKATANGIISDALLNFASDGLRIMALDESKTGGVNALLRKETSFAEYEEMKVPIRSTPRLLSFVKMAEGIAEISVKGNLFTMSCDNVEFSIVTSKQEFLKCPTERWLSVEYSNEFNVDVGKMFSNTRSITSELGITDKIIATLHDGVFRLQIGTSGISDVAVPKAVVDCMGSAEATYGSTLLDISKVIKGVAKIAFDTDLPMLISQSDDIQDIQWVVSPIVEE